MGGTRMDDSENPLEINVTAMVDVIFCLCIFFMCSFHFKQLEGKIDAWLPDGKGPRDLPVREVILEEIRLFMSWDSASNRTVRKVGNRPPVGSDAELVSTLRTLAEDYKKAGRDIPVLIDSRAEVPWQDVVGVLDLCMKEKIGKIEFAEPLESALPRRAN